MGEGGGGGVVGDEGDGVYRAMHIHVIFYTILSDFENGYYFHSEFAPYKCRIVGRHYFVIKVLLRKWC